MIIKFWIDGEREDEDATEFDTYQCNVNGYLVERIAQWLLKKYGFEAYGSNPYFIYIRESENVIKKFKVTPVISVDYDVNSVEISQYELSKMS